jgi:phage tail sheath gpL-like
MTISQPDITINIIPAASTISNEPQKVLFIGQSVAAGTATNGDLEANIGNAGEEDTLFGATSMLAQMIRAARTLNGVTQFDAIPLADNGSGVDATGTIAFVGTASATGTLSISVGSGLNYTLSIAVASGDSITTIGDAVDTAVAALTNAPFTSSNAAGTVTFTAVNAGTVGNGFALKVVGTVAGIATTVTGFASGATDPVLTSLFDVIDGERYQTIVWPGGYATTELTTLLDARFNATNDVLDGVGVLTLIDTFANIQTAANALNSTSITMLSNKLLTDAQHKGGALVEFADVESAKFAAVRSLRLTDGANISQFVISTNGARDSFGGAAIASLPYFNTPFPNLSIIDRGKGFTTVETESLLTAGASTLANNKTRTSIIAGELATTRKTDAAGNVEATFKFLNAVDTSSAIREFYFNNLRARFAQSRLTEGDLQPNRNIANKAVIESFLDNLYQQLSGEDFVLTQAGPTAVNFFKANRTVSLDLLTGTVTINMKMPIVTQLRTIVATIQIAFSTEG